MCGPISLALPIAHYSRLYQYFAGIIYHISRTVGYILLGLLIGFIGQNFIPAFLQNWLSIVIGIIIIIRVVYTKLLLVKNKPNLFVAFEKFVKNAMLYALQKRGLFSYSILGIANAFLPCGVVYIAIAAAISFHNTLLSAVFMLGFGVGTIPLMLLLFFTGLQVKFEIKKYIKQLSPYALFFVGVLLVIRGLIYNNKLINEKTPILNHIISCF
jgi:uncharacterized protein